MTTMHETPEMATGRALDDLSRLLFGHLHRSDQQRWGMSTYRACCVRTARRPCAAWRATVTGSEATSSSLHQFVNASPWEWAPVRSRLARWATRSLPVRS